MASFYTETTDGLVLTVKVKPGTSKARAMKIVDIGDGKEALEMAVSAPPEGGRANKAVCEVLAEAFGVPRAAVTIKAGHTGRLKIVEVQGVDEVGIKQLL